MDQSGTGWIWCARPVRVRVGFTDAGWSSSVARRAHNPEVAGSNPAPATNASAVSPQVRGPLPMGEGLLTCVPRDQIRDQIADQRRPSRPTPSQAERRIEIRGTYCNGSGHLGHGRRVETQRSHLGSCSQVSECHPPVVGKIGADGGIVLPSSSQVRDGDRKPIFSRDGPGASQRRPSADRNSPVGGSLIRTDGLEGAVLGGGLTLLQMDVWGPRKLSLRAWEPTRTGECPIMMSRWFGCPA